MIKQSTLAYARGAQLALREMKIANALEKRSVDANLRTLMMIYDCFLYYDEDMLLDIRLNTLADVIDRFVIVESTHTFTGKKRQLNFDINTVLLKIKLFMLCMMKHLS
ncbi:hypothetical protein APT89_04375 [Enterobacter sp. 50588862]|nr:hypothetical protein APT89_04375 [Enterobacter sp. 50588862]